MANRGGFSWKRATGVTNYKRKISKATGIPTTKDGRKRKAARTLSGGCLTFMLLWAVLIAVAVVLICIL